MAMSGSICRVEQADGHKRSAARYHRAAED